MCRADHGADPVAQPVELAPTGAPHREPWRCAGDPSLRLGEGLEHPGRAAELPGATTPDGRVGDQALTAREGNDAVALEAERAPLVAAGVDRERGAVGRAIDGDRNLHHRERRQRECVVAGLDSYGGRSLHEQSHGEAFWSLLQHKFRGQGLYLLDEPEAALSPSRQMSMLVRLHDLVGEASQFVIATHSPILMAYPDAWIYQIGPLGLSRVAYEATEHVDVTRRFLNHHEAMLRQLLHPPK